jgi:hypothetical protein
MSAGQRPPGQPAWTPALRHRHAAFRIRKMDTPEHALYVCRPEGRQDSRRGRQRYNIGMRHAGAWTRHLVRSASSHLTAVGHRERL